MAEIDPKLKQILDQLKKFGFEFYGYGENGSHLVKGPNKQVIEINVAIQFVNKQAELQKQSSSSGGIENAPQMNQNMDATISPDRNMDSKLEKPRDQVNEKKSNPAGLNASSQYKVKDNAPKISLKKARNISYGDGFDPVSFDPNSIRSALRFIEKSSKKHRTSSDKWLATLFEKFTREQKLGIKK